ncbi:hypothetical protein [Haladaptatus sp. DYSN1]|uniref:hypothetical protein n=1 Tax=unclassified Haladaptatus TaxID=2622732 RepID=UPI002405608D|nr:hypothetical protein [Haladaptatus sp. DYSN1]
MDQPQGSILASEKVKLALVLVVGVLGSGLADYFLTTSGYPGIGRAVWATGYVTMVLIIWYVWIRPLDISSPTG